MPIPQTKEFPLQSHPSLVYWFWKPDTHQRREYLRHCQILLNTTPFSHLAYTQRAPTGGCSVEPKFRPEAPLVQRHLTEVGRRCQEAGANLVLQLWEFPIRTRFPHSYVREFKSMTTRGYFDFKLPAGQWKVLAVYSFEAIGWASFRSRTLLDITAHCRLQTAGGRCVLSGLDSTGQSRRRVYALVISTEPRLWDYDALAPDFRAKLGRYLSVFRDLPICGLALDEYNRTAEVPGIDHHGSFIYSPGGDRFFRAQTGHSMAEAVLHLRYADLDDPTLQPRLIHAYLRFLREFCLEGERMVAEKGQEFFGPDAFRGFHATYAEDWIPDGYDGYRAVSTGVDVEMWLHGFHHWELPRSYAQVDTINLYPLRFGLARCCPKPVWISMFFAAGKTNLLEAANAARFGGRIHWHAFNDAGGWGLDLAGNHRLRETIAKAERKIQLLNAVQAAQPRSDLLVLMGYNGSLNWRQGQDPLYYTETMQFAHRLFWAGQVCDLVPSYEVANGRLRLEKDGRIRYGCATYKGVLWTAPDFAERKTLALLGKYTDGGGRLWIVGEGGRDEEGRDVSSTLRRLTGQAVACWTEFPAVATFAASLKPAGIVPGSKDACTYIDDSAVWTNGDSFWDGKSCVARLPTSAGCLTANALGLLAARFAKNQELDWLVAGHTQQVCLDGKPLVKLPEPCSFVIRREKARWRMRAQSETGRIAIGGQVAGAVVPPASLTLKVRRESGRVVVEACGVRPSPATAGGSFQLQPLVDWQVKPAWEQKVKSADHIDACRVTWELTPKRALLHPGIDVQVLWVSSAPGWQVELYARVRSEGRGGK